MGTLPNIRNIVSSRERFSTVLTRAGSRGIGCGKPFGCWEHPKLDGTGSKGIQGPEVGWL
jgi:hypothetical protein